MKRVVIADDSAMARMFIRRCLEIVGLRDADFVEAVNGEDALDKIQAAPTDLLVTDLNMPILDGEQMLLKLSQLPPLPRLKVLVVTSGNHTAKEESLKKLGAHAVLNKPLSPANLSSALKNLLPEDQS